MSTSTDSKDQNTYQFDDLEDYVIEEFTTEFHEVHDDVETILLKLETQPDNNELLNDIFRSIHTVKGNLQMIGLDPIAEFVHALESVLDKIRKNTLQFDKQLSEAILLSMDLTNEMCDTVFERKPLEVTTTQIVANELIQIANSPQGMMAHHAKNIIRLLAPNTTVASDEKEITAVDNTDDAVINSAASSSDKRSVNSSINNNGINIFHVEHRNDEKLKQVDQTSDIALFIRLAETMEARSPYWAGKTQRVLKIAQQINAQVGNALDPEQLEAAVYLHDCGMAFISLDILHKSSKLTNEEFNMIKNHPLVGADLISRLSGWDEAKQIILQHHERADGKGYPNRLRGKQISDGAYILAIADSFEAMTQKRADREQKRPLLRAVSEINSCSGSQFSKYWVGVFNDVIRHKKVKKSA